MHKFRGRRLAFLFIFSTALATGLMRAQTVDDGVMLKRNLLCTGTMFTHDSWTKYWEGSLERVNGNIGTVTTQTVMSSSDFAVLDRVNILSSIPYVWTDASSGVLRGKNGFQDITAAAKVRLYDLPVRRFGTLRAIGVFSASACTPADAAAVRECEGLDDDAG